MYQRANNSHSYMYQRVTVDCYSEKKKPQRKQTDRQTDNLHL